MNQTNTQIVNNNEQSISCRISILSFHNMLMKIYE